MEETRKIAGGGGDKGCHFVSFASKIGRDWNPLNYCEGFTLARLFKTHKNKSEEILSGGKSCQISLTSQKMLNGSHFLRQSVSNFDRGQIITPQYKSKAFTLAEVLITLAIIGVVAALTIPSVISSYKDKQYNTARLKALKTFGEAGKMASINDEMKTQANAKDFVNIVLSKYLKITKVCDNAHPTDCNFPSEIQPLNPKASKLPVDATHLIKWNQIGSPGNTGIIASVNSTNLSTIISTNDGFSAKVFYNPKCVRDSREATWNNCTHKECHVNNGDVACLNFIYDMNGLKGPNHVGEDIGVVTVFWSGFKTTAVAPGIIPYSVNTTGTTNTTILNAPGVCSDKSTSKALYTMPNIDEISSLYLNRTLTSVPDEHQWSGSQVVSMPGHIWMVYGLGHRNYYSANAGYNFRVWCVRR